MPAETQQLITSIQHALKLIDKIDFDLYTELTGDDEAGSRVVGTLKSMIDYLQNPDDQDNDEESDEEE